MIRIRRTPTLVLLAFALATLNAVGAQAPYALLHSLFNPGTNGQTAALQGWSVAVDGTIAVVGAPLEDAGATNSGVVRVYNAATGTLLHTLINPNPAVDDRFGSAVAISGVRLVVGAPSADTGAMDAGIVYVYNLAGATPTVPSVITNPSPTYADGFGRTVAISGSRLVVGGGTSISGGRSAAAVRVYDLSGVQPGIPVTTLSNAGPLTELDFYGPVAISGTRVVVGSPYYVVGTNNAGRVLVYDLTQAVPPIALPNPRPQTTFHFGNSLGIDGTRVVVGFSGPNWQLPSEGSGYVYDLASATPSVPVLTLAHRIPIPANTYGQFNFSVALAGARVVVGAPFDDTGELGSGSIHLYDLAGSSPADSVATFTKPATERPNGFGRAVGIAGATVLVGAAYDDTAGTSQGAAYVFGLLPALSILPAAPGFATISWTPATSSGFVLQYTDGFAPTNWVTVSSGAANPATVPVTNALGFYRLFQP